MGKHSRRTRSTGAIVLTTAGASAVAIGSTILAPAAGAVPVTVADHTVDIPQEVIDAARQAYEQAPTAPREAALEAARQVARTLGIDPAVIDDVLAQTVLKQDEVPVVVPEPVYAQPAPEPEPAPAPEPEPAPAPVITQGQSVVDAALSRVGMPYVYGAAGPNAFDCSGLVYWAYQQIGKPIPRTSQAQAAQGWPVSLDALQPGDVISFYGGATHVGVYIGDGKVVHAMNESYPVRIDPMSYMPIYNAVRYV